MMPLITKPLLTPDELRFHDALQAWLSETHGARYQLICKTTLPVVANPAVEDEQVPSEFWSAILDYCIVVDRIHGPPRLVLITIDNPDKAYILALLDTYPVQAMEIDSTQPFNQTVGTVSAVLNQRPPQVVTKMPKTQGNAYEFWLKERAYSAFHGFLEHHRREIVGGTGHIGRRIFIEPCLAKYIDIPGDRTDTVIQYGRTSRADVLICENNPDLTPLLQLEFDGPTHRTQAGMRKDRKKEALLAQAGIPLLRIGFEDMPFTLESSRGNVKALSISVDSEDSKPIFDEIISQILLAIVNNAAFEKVERPRIGDKVDTLFREQLLPRLAQARQQYGPGEVPEGVVQDIFRDAYEANEDVEIEANSELAWLRMNATEFLKGGEKTFDDLLWTTGGTLTIEDADECSSSSSIRRAVFRTNTDELSISVPNIRLRYLALPSAQTASTRAALALFPEISFSGLAEVLVLRAIRCLIQLKHVTQPFVQSISLQELEDYRQFWHRPKSAQEKQFLKACDRLAALERSARFTSKAQAMSAERQPSPEVQDDIERIRALRLDADLGLPWDEDDSPSTLKRLPTLQEYAAQFNRSAHACLRYPGVRDQLLKPHHGAAIREAEWNKCEREFRHDEVRRAIELKSQGQPPLI